MDMNSHEDRWTYFNDKRCQNATAILRPGCDFVPFVDNFFPLVSFFVALHGPLSSLFQPLRVPSRINLLPP